MATRTYEVRYDSEKEIAHISATNPHAAAEYIARSRNTGEDWTLVDLGVYYQAYRPTHSGYRRGFEAVGERIYVKGAAAA